MTRGAVIETKIASIIWKAVLIAGHRRVAGDSLLVTSPKTKTSLLVTTQEAPPNENKLQDIIAAVVGTAK
jgi:predicted NAD/FAD-dependent oxidoreductase